MGTRSLTVVKHKNEIRIAQSCSNDGDPYGEGRVVLDFLTNTTKVKLLKCIFDAQRVKFFENEKQTKEFVDVLINDKRFHSFPSYHVFYKNYIENFLLQSVGANVLTNLIERSHGNTVFLRNDFDFGYLSDYCNWGYVIDFDSKTFDIYTGFNNKRLSSDELFYKKNKKSDFYGIKKFISYSFDNLPTHENFMKDFYEKR